MAVQRRKGEQHPAQGPGEVERIPGAVPRPGERDHTPGRPGIPDHQQQFPDRLEAGAIAKGPSGHQPFDSHASDESVHLGRPRAQPAGEGSGRDHLTLDDAP